MRNFISRAKRLLVVAPATILFAIAAAAAGPADDVSPAVRQALQRDLGLTSAQVSQYLTIERLATAQEKQLVAAQGVYYAGSWIERQGNGNFKLVVASTKGAQRAPAGVEIRAARYSLADLDASKAQLDSMLTRGEQVPAGVYGWYVDVQGNSVVLAIGKGGQKAGIDFVAASGASVDSIRFVVEEEQPSLRSDLKGGLGYLRNPGDGYLYACSIGFNVTKGSTPGFVTAGHCGEAGESVYLELSPKWTLGPKIGTFTASSFPQPGETGNDYSWVTEVAGNNFLPVVYGWGAGDVTVRGSTEAAIGAAICRSGRTSGWRCGTIEAKGQTVRYTSGETILNLTRTTACSEGGDSGGSFITTPGQGQGVLSGGSGNCKGKLPNKRTRSYYQPLLPILSAYGLTLRIGA